MENGICECIECGSLHAPGAQYGNTPELARLAAEVERLKTALDVAEGALNTTNEFLGCFDEGAPLEFIGDFDISYEELTAKVGATLRVIARVLKSGEAETDGESM